MLLRCKYITAGISMDVKHMHKEVFEKLVSSVQELSTEENGSIGNFISFLQSF
jgi:hypothetical protein